MEKLNLNQFFINHPSVHMWRQSSANFIGSSQNAPTLLGQNRIEQNSPSLLAADSIHQLCLVFGHAKQFQFIWGEILSLFKKTAYYSVLILFIFGIRMDKCNGQEDPDCSFLITRSLCIESGYQLCVEAISQTQDTYTWTITAPGLTPSIASTQRKLCVNLSLAANTQLTITLITTIGESSDTCVRQLRVNDCSDEDYCEILDPSFSIDSCRNLSVSITNPAPLNYTWTYGDNTPAIVSNANNMTHEYQSPGVYQVCITNTSGFTGYYFSCCFNVVIDPCDCFEFNWSQCSTQAREECCFEFTVSTIYEIDSIVWDFGDGRGIKVDYDTITQRDFIGSGPYWVCAKFYIDSTHFTCCDSVFLPPCECCTSAAFEFEPLESEEQYPPSCMKKQFRINASCDSSGMTIHKWEFSDGTIYIGQYPDHEPPDHFFTNFITEDGEICVTHKVYCDTFLMDEVTHCLTIPEGAYLGLPLGTLKMSDYLTNQGKTVYQFILDYMNHSTVPLLIEGNLIVDINVSFGEGTWYMAVGSLITVNEGKSFHLNETVLQTATRLGNPFGDCCRWRGIEAYRRTSLEWTNAEIWDAIKALYIKGSSGSQTGAKIKFVSCRFEENIDGIHFDLNHTIKMEQFHDNYLKGCWDTDCTALCGCEDGTAIIIDRNLFKQWIPSTGEVNEIERFVTGIKVTNAIARIRNFTIHDLKSTGIDYTKNIGSNKSLNLDSLMFEDMPLAVKVRTSGGASDTLTAAASVPLSSIWTNNVHKAFDIHVRNTKIIGNIEKAHLHTDNGPENFAVKVHISGSSGNTFSVSRNDIQTNGGDHTVGVSFTADAEGPQSGYITNNRILNNATNNGAGIFVHNWHGTRIQNDTITSNNPKPGIDISHSRQSVITCNRVLEGGTGLLFVNNPETTISDNYFYDNSNRCIDTRGNCMGSLIRRNIFSLSSSNSNWYELGATTGAQLHSQYNTWASQNNNHNNFGEIHHLSRFNDGILKACRFLAPTGSTEGSTHHPYRTEGMILASGPSLGSQTIVCNGGPVMLQSDTISAYGYAAILADSAGLDSLPDALKTALYQSIFAEILLYPHWTSLSDTLSDFYEALENEYVGESSVLYTDINSYLLEIEDQQLVFDSFDVLHSGVVDSMIIVEELIEVETDLDTLALYETLLDSLQAQLADLEEAIGSYRYLCDSLNAEAIELLEVSNNALDPQNDAEEYDQWVTEQRLKLLNGIALDSTTLAELMVLSAMCRDSAGIAVNNSRGFTLALLDKYIPLFNCEEEEFGGQQFGLKKSIPVGIYPNPSTGIVLIESDINAELIRNVRISDLYGRHQIHRPILNKHGSIGLDFSSLSSGIYIVEMLNAEGKTISTQRLMIHR